MFIQILCIHMRMSKSYCFLKKKLCLFASKYRVVTYLMAILQTCWHEPHHHWSGYSREQVISGAWKLDILTSRIIFRLIGTQNIYSIIELSFCSLK